MKVTVKMGAPLSQVVGEKKVILHLEEGTTAAGLLAELGRRYPDFDEGLKGKGLRKPFDRVLYQMFLNGRPLAFEDAAGRRLSDGDRIALFLPVAGGD
ncbi:MAG: MoaD/ThiS family protein [Anaerolineae bacterium]|jgi:molybdopterin converting factor small subunit